MTEPTIEATCYTVSCIPEDAHPMDHDTWAIKVEYAGRGRWAIRHLGKCLKWNGTWDYEPIPSSREDNWLHEHRFSLEIAKQLAVEAAPKVRLNGKTPADVLAHHAALGITQEDQDG